MYAFTTSYIVGKYIFYHILNSQYKSMIALKYFFLIINTNEIKLNNKNLIQTIILNQYSTRVVY